MKFENLQLNGNLLKAIEQEGYHTPTPIQAQAIPPAMLGHDVVATAQTGTGKTAAYGIPVLQMVDPAVRRTQALVLAPTRELAHAIDGRGGALERRLTVGRLALRGLDDGLEVLERLFLRRARRPGVVSTLFSSSSEARAPSRP